MCRIISKPTFTQHTELNSTFIFSSRKTGLFISVICRIPFKKQLPSRNWSPLGMYAQCLKLQTSGLCTGFYIRRGNIWHCALTLNINEFLVIRIRWNLTKCPSPWQHSLVSCFGELSGQRNFLLVWSHLLENCLTTHIFWSLYQFATQLCMTG